MLLSVEGNKGHRYLNGKGYSRRKELAKRGPRVFLPQAAGESFEHYRMTGS